MTIDDSPGTEDWKHFSSCLMQTETCNTARFLPIRLVASTDRNIRAKGQRGFLTFSMLSFFICQCTLAYMHECTHTYTHPHTRCTRTYTPWCTPRYTPSHRTALYTNCTPPYTEFCTSAYTQNARAYIHNCTVIYTPWRKIQKIELSNFCENLNIQIFVKIWKLTQIKQNAVFFIKNVT